MIEMDDKAGIDPELREEIRKHRLVGVEQQPQCARGRQGEPLPRLVLRSKIVKQLKEGVPPAMHIFALAVG
ncbi:MAG: hypothetical protein ACLQB1_39845 [Streptosporangiaceae bacterium]